MLRTEDVCLLLQTIATGRDSPPQKHYFILTRSKFKFCDTVSGNNNVQVLVGNIGNNIGKNYVPHLFTQVLTPSFSEYRCLLIQHGKSAAPTFISSIHSSEYEGISKLM